MKWRLHELSLSPRELDIAARSLIPFLRKISRAACCMCDLGRTDHLLDCLSCTQFGVQIADVTTKNVEDEVLHDLERDLDLEETGALFQRGE